MPNGQQPRNCGAQSVWTGGDDGRGLCVIVIHHSSLCLWTLAFLWDTALRVWTGLVPKTDAGRAVQVNHLWFTPPVEAFARPPGPISGPGAGNIRPGAVYRGNGRGDPAMPVTSLQEYPHVVGWMSPCVDGQCGGSLERQDRSSLPAPVTPHGDEA